MEALRVGGVHFRRQIVAGVERLLDQQYLGGENVEQALPVDALTAPAAGAQVVGGDTHSERNSPGVVG